MSCHIVSHHARYCSRSYRCLKKKHSCRKEDPWGGKPSEFQIRGWTAASAAEGLQGKGWRQRSSRFPHTRRSERTSRESIYCNLERSHAAIIMTFFKTLMNITRAQIPGLNKIMQIFVKSYANQSTLDRSRAESCFVSKGRGFWGRMLFVFLLF